MKRFSLFLAALFTGLCLFAQSPQKISYQAIIRNSDGKLLQNSQVGVKISILQGSASGTVVYSETHNVTSNDNGMITLEIGGGTSIGNFSDINWATGSYFIKTETDPAGSTNYTITGTSQLLSVPYSLYSQIAGNGFSGDYNDLTNKPVTDGSETKVLGGNGIFVTGTGTLAAPYSVSSNVDGSETKLQAGSNVTITGGGTTVSPYVISSSPTSSSNPVKTTITTSQYWTVPASVSRIKVELWGAAGGGGGAGAYSYSYNLSSGGYGGTGGYALREFAVTGNEQFYITVGQSGTEGTNATYVYPYYYYGDTDGGDGGDTWFGTLVKAAGGTGGKRGSFYYNTVNGLQGTSNIGNITGYAEDPQSTILNVFQGLERSYINDRVLTSKPGKGGNISPYSTNTNPTPGEGGCAIITLFE